MPRLLLVVGEPLLQQRLQKVFAADEHFCAVAEDAEQARAALQGDTFDLVVLEQGQPPGSGLSLLCQIRRRHHTPVLILAPTHSVVETVLGLDTGADDYVCVPFDPRELRARVRAQLRRAGRYSRPAEEGDRYDLGGVVLDVSQRDAFRQGIALNLTTREFELLYLLARHRGETLASQRIFESVWGYTAECGLKALTVCVGRVRRKIEVDAQHPRLLVSVRGFGYRLVTESECAAQPTPADTGRR
jgi:DNA-binding response OmpR family regulator